MNTVLIIDDEPTIRMLLGHILELEGYEVVLAKDRAHGIDALKKCKAEVVLCDVFLPDGNGVDMVPELKSVSPSSNIVLLTAHGNIPDGVQAIKNGAFDYIVKGDDNRKIIPLVSRAMEDCKKSKKPSSEKKRKENGFASVIGTSACLQHSIKMAEKVAVSDLCVLLTGETGTGKEVFARAIHESSRRKNKPFVAINCSAFSKELLESEMFGYISGSFTGATKDKKGLFEEADGGTIFLDEIGEMEFGLQAKLLRAIEENEFIKVGDTKYTRIDVRIIAATNRNLMKEIDNGHFREDLYFRLAGFQIELPPLRERKGDVKQLCDFFISHMSQKMGIDSVKISSESMKMLENYSWPGNIRELRNVIERSLIVCDGEITPDDLPVDIQLNSSPLSPSSNEFDLATVEKNHIAKILAYTKGNKTETARLLKIGLTTLYRKIDEYNIK